MLDVPDWNRSDFRAGQILITRDESLSVRYAIIDAVIGPALEHPKRDLRQIDGDFLVFDGDLFRDRFRRTVENTIIGTFDGLVDQQQTGEPKCDGKRAGRNQQVEKQRAA